MNYIYLAFVCFFALIGISVNILSIRTLINEYFTVWNYYLFTAFFVIDFIFDELQVSFRKHYIKQFIYVIVANMLCVDFGWIFIRYTNKDLIQNYTDKMECPYYLMTVYIYIYSFLFHWLPLGFIIYWLYINTSIVTFDFSVNSIYLTFTLGLIYLLYHKDKIKKLYLQNYYNLENLFKLVCVIILSLLSPLAINNIYNYV